MFSCKILLYLFICILYATAEKTDSKEVAVSTSSTYKTIAVVTALTTVAAGIVAIAAWIIPLIAYKFCYIFGSCDYGLGVYVDQFLMGGRRKRSEDYVGPLLHTLSKAYDIYAGSDEISDPKKNSKMEISSRR